MFTMTRAVIHFLNFIQFGFGKAERFFRENMLSNRECGLDISEMTIMSCGNKDSIDIIVFKNVLGFSRAELEIELL